MGSLSPSVPALVVEVEDVPDSVPKLQVGSDWQADKNRSTTKSPGLGAVMSAVQVMLLNKLVTLLVSRQV